MPVTVRCRKERTAPRKRTSTRWKVGRVNATENAQTSGSAALGRRNISDSIPVRWTVIIRECTGESDLFGVRVHKNRRLKTAKVELRSCFKTCVAREKPTAAPWAFPAKTWGFETATK